MKLLWVIERNLFWANDQAHFVEALRARRAGYILVDYVPFAHEIQPTPTRQPEGNLRFALGSTGMVRAVRDRHPDWTPGVWYNDNFRFDVWREKLGDGLLNHDAQLVAYKDISFTGKRFIRPNEDLKAFTGCVVADVNLPAWRENIEQYSRLADEDLIRPDLPCVVAEPKEIVSEHRFFVVDGRVVSGCRYRHEGRPDESIRYDDVIDAAHFAADVAEHWQPAEGFVLDVATTERGWFVLEFNCLNAAGIYACPVLPIIDGVEQLLVGASARTLPVA